MEITSNLLGDLANAAKRSSPNTFETLLQVPPIIHPVLILRDDCYSLQIAATVVIEKSFMFSEDRQVANSGTQNQNIFILSPGVWELNLDLNYTSNYASIGGLGYRVDLALGTQQTSILNAQCSPTAGGVVSHTRSFVIQITQNATISSTLFVNGAGQNHQASLSCVVNRLL